MKVYLLKDYKNHGKGEIIETKDEFALDLILLKVARRCKARDFLVKPKFGKSKAFNTSPNQINIKKK